MLRGGRLGGVKREREETDPASGVTNLADVMLVFMVGLMLSVIAYYGPDFNFESNEGDSAYNQVGYIYVDSETGKEYLIVK